jgi:transposase-like protein
MVKAFEAELKELVRGLMEALIREERAMYLERHPTKANGYYTRDLLTLVGPVKDLRQRGAQRVRILISDDLPWLEEAIKKIFPEAERPIPFWRFCITPSPSEGIFGIFIGRTSWYT